MSGGPIKYAPNPAAMGELVDGIYTIRNHEGTYCPLPRVPEDDVPEPEFIWRDHAACKGLDPAFFFPPRRISVKVGNIIASFCEPCPVRRECLQHAVETNEKGWWGGTSNRQRRLWRREGLTFEEQFARGVSRDPRVHEDRDFE